MLLNILFLFLGFVLWNLLHIFVVRSVIQDYFVELSNFEQILNENNRNISTLKKAFFVSKTKISSE